MILDKNGNPDVMGSRSLNAPQIVQVETLKLEFNALHQKLMLSSSPEAARLFAIARTHLEIACMSAVKAISRDHGTQASK